MEALLESVLPADWQRLLDRVRAGERLSAADGTRLIATDRLAWLGALACEARRVRVGDQVLIATSVPVNYARICARLTRQTASGKVRHIPDGPTKAIELVVAEAELHAGRGAVELRLMGGLRPDLPFEWYVRLLQRLGEALPQLSVRAFTAADLLYLTRLTRLPLPEVIRQLRDAGLDSLLGGGAVIFSQRVRGMVLKPGDTAEQWLSIHDAAHRLGLKTNATMLYGHIETSEEMVDHLLRLRQQQDRSGGFQTFIPVNAGTARAVLADSGDAPNEADLRVLAVARLLLDNFRFIQPCRAADSPQPVQSALAYGANDVDEAASREALVAAIWQADLIPVERDAAYNMVREYPVQGPVN